MTEEELTRLAERLSDLMPSTDPDETWFEIVDNKVVPKRESNQGIQKR